LAIPTKYLCIARVVFVKCRQSPVAGALSDGATGTTSANNWFQTGNVATLALWHPDHYRAMYAPEIVLLQTAYISNYFLELATDASIQK
jgi:hypothetical protein